MEVFSGQDQLLMPTADFVDEGETLTKCFCVMVVIKVITCIA